MKFEKKHTHTLVNFSKASHSLVHIFSKLRQFPRPREWYWQQNLTMFRLKDDVDFLNKDLVYLKSFDVRD